MGRAALACCTRTTRPGYWPPSPGAGKTLLGLHFLAEGVRHDEPGLFLGFMESPAQLRQKARVLGLALDGADLQVLPAYDLEADRVADQLCRAIDHGGVRRLVVDSTSHLERAIGDPARRADFFAALVGYLRARQVTTYLPHEVGKIVGPDLDFGDTPLSVLAENLLLRYTEFGGR